MSTSNIVSAMRELNLSAVNLNLLVHLDALVEEGNVTRAAKREGVTQSAMSHSLQKLRELLDDPLLVRHGARNELTSAARALRQPLRKALLDVQRIVRDAGRFDPTTAERLFQCACPDFLSVLLMPKVATRLQRRAPGMDLEIVPNQPLRYPYLLETGEIDFALGGVLPAEPGIRRIKLYTETLACAVRKGHPRVKKRITAEQYARLGHCLITVGESRTPTWVDDRLRRLGLQRRIVVRTRSFLAAPQIVAHSDLVVTGPRRLCEYMAKPFDLQLFEFPLEPISFEEELLWHERAEDDPGHRWMRRVFAEVARSL
jgi:DNA-binding transcriptional LysR family regulator